MDNSLSRLIKPLLRKDNHGKKKKTDMLVVWIVIIAVVFLLIGNLFEKDDRREKGKNISQESVNYSEEMYIKNMEERLTGVLKKINGTGNISIFISFENGGEKILATEQTMKKEQEDADGEKNNFMEAEEKIVLSDIDGDKIPYVVEERKPVPAGILIVAEGAENEEVRNKLYEAAKAIFGLSAHRIKITN